jgi:hypothetical protein
MDTNNKQENIGLVNELNTELQKIFQPFFDSASHINVEFPIITHNNKENQFIICKKIGDSYSIEGPKSKSLFKIPFYKFKSKLDNLIISVNNNLIELFKKDYADLILRSGDGYYYFLDSLYKIDLLLFLEQYLNTFHRTLHHCFTKFINSSNYSCDFAQFPYKKLDLELDESKFHLENLKEKALFLNDYLKHATVEKVIVYKHRNSSETTLCNLPFSLYYLGDNDVNTLNLDVYTKKELNQIKIQYGTDVTFISIGFRIRFKGYSLFFTTKEYIEDMEKAFNLKPMDFNADYIYLGANYCEVGFGISEGYSFNPRTENQDFIQYLQSKFIQRLASDGHSLNLPGLTYKIGGRKTLLKNILQGENLDTQRNRNRLSNSYQS